MATRRPFWKWPRWKSIGFCLWPPSTCIWSLKLKFQSKPDLYPGNLVTYRVQKPKNLIWRQVAILKLTSLKINRLLPMVTINMHMKFEIEIRKQTWLMLRKPCRLQTDRRTDGQGESSIPPLQLRWAGYNKSLSEDVLTSMVLSHHQFYQFFWLLMTFNILSSSFVMT